MEQREFLFRGKKVYDKSWCTGYLVKDNDGTCFIVNNYGDSYTWDIVIPETIGQYSGHRVKEKKLFEGDIVRNEIMNDEGDIMKYMVCTYINEWSMFALLWAYEYRSYLNDGAEYLDESMFWTFPIEDKDNENRSICGTIYDNPELLQSL